MAKLATIEARRVVVARLMATMSKPTCRMIAERLKQTDPPYRVSKTTAANDMKAVREEWKKARLRSMDEVIGEEVEKTLILEEQLWRDLARGQHDREELNVTTERVPVAVPQKDGSHVVEFHEKRTTRTRIIPGGTDPRIAKTMVDVLKRRHDILGLDAAKSLNLDVDSIRFSVDPGHPEWEPPKRTKTEQERIAALLDDVPDVEED